MINKIKNTALVLSLIYIVVSIIYMRSGDEIIDEKVTIEKVETVKEDTKPLSVTPVQVKVSRADYPEKFPVIKKSVVKNDSLVEEITYSRLDSLIVEAKEYHYRDSVSNGVLDSWITADNVYSRRIKLTTYNVNKEITVVRSLWFLEFGPSFRFDNKLKDITIGVNYIHKGKWSFGMKVGYDALSKDPYYGFKIGIPLNKNKR